MLKKGTDYDGISIKVAPGHPVNDVVAHGNLPLMAPPIPPHSGARCQNRRSFRGGMTSRSCSVRGAWTRS